MTVVAKRFCAYPGCNALVDHGRCYRHTRVMPDTKTPEERMFYGSARWKALRAAHLRQHPLCVMCQAEGSIVAGRIVDHKKTVRAGADPYDAENLQTLCDRHHNAKRSEEARQARAGSQKLSSTYNRQIGRAHV